MGMCGLHLPLGPSFNYAMTMVCIVTLRICIWMMGLSGTLWSLLAMIRFVSNPRVVEYERVVEV